jgi:hypothetical protein
MKGLSIGTIVRRRPWDKASQAGAQGQIIGSFVWVDAQKRQMPYYQIQRQGLGGKPFIKPFIDCWPASHCQPIDMDNELP